MFDFSNASPVLKYFVLLLAAGAGYLIFSRILDALIPPKDSEKEKKPFPPSPSQTPTNVEDVEDLRRQQDEAYQSWEKTRRK